MASRNRYSFPTTSLENSFVKNCYYQCATTSGLWQHKWRPIIFGLIVDNFDVEYVGERHSQNLSNVIKEHYDITENWKGDLYAGINLTWDYVKRTCRLTMDN